MGNLNEATFSVKVDDLRPKRVIETFRMLDGVVREYPEDQDGTLLKIKSSSVAVLDEAIRVGFDLAGATVVENHPLRVGIVLEEFQVSGGIQEAIDPNKEAFGVLAPVVEIAVPFTHRPDEVSLQPVHATVRFRVSVTRNDALLFRETYEAEANKHVRSFKERIRPNISAISSYAWPGFWPDIDPRLRKNTDALARTEEALSDALTVAIRKMLVDEDLNRALRRKTIPQHTGSTGPSVVAPQGTPTEPSPKSRTVWRPSDFSQVWVLAIGVGNYEADGEIPRLPFAEKDARRFADWFIGVQDGLNRENVRVFFNEEATYQNVLDGIDWLRQEALPEDAVVFYFAGHGAPELASNGTSVDAKYLLLYDSDPEHLFSTGLAIDELTQRLDSIGAKTQLVVFEACYAGPVGERLLQQTPTADLEIRPRFIQTLGERGSRTILSASTGRQVAIGWDELGNSLFTHYLLESWGDGQRRLLSDAFDEAHERTRRAANRLGSRQEPTKYGDQNLDIIFR